MKIRFATRNDIPACTEIGRRMAAVTRFAAYDFNAERLAQNLGAVIDSGHAKGTHCLFVAEDTAGQLIGLLIGCIERHFFSDLLVASIIHYDVLPEKRMGGAGLKLLAAFRQWAENRSAFELSVGINSGVEMEKMDRFLKRLGFRRTGGNYSLPLVAERSVR
ncbi:MAG: GNAT family N-acetyltransferase [Azonexus sp.]|jgi:L-amino acid N-acyltransferase YncA|uniref:GNAT family N-acetyltransferase n=1 Tax=Azonexus sp. TaxID=1872668 RepID=UPI00281F4BA7|nr:GNAT family N-acetyltransferase [Azonexus sp.]MDR0775588.1 GNAT family N-acetyltransferase [Azonexus sp.]